MRRNWLSAISLILVLAVLALAGCRAGKAPASESQIATVQRGNLKIDITATGNLALSHTEDLAFPIAGIVEEVMVNTGDPVTEGQELTKLDTSEWDKQLKTLQKALVTAQRNLTTAERQVGAKELAVRQAQLDLQTAQDNLEKIADVKAAQDMVDSANETVKVLQIAGAGMAGVTITDYAWWLTALAAAQQGLAQAQKDRQNILEGITITVSSNVALQVAKSQLQVEQSQRKLEDAQIAVDDAKSARDDAEQAVKDAQSDLDEAKSLSPIIKAPFAGFITQVNVKGGDEVKKGAIAMTLADPAKFEANILVSETDIFKVKLQGAATVQVDAIPQSSFPATVTSIAPTATIQSGVVNYKVKVELQSLPPVSGNQSGQRPQLTPGGQAPSASENQSGQSRRFQSMPGSQALSALTPATQLRQGLSVTVNILVEQRTNVILVPNRAIIRRSGQSLVQVQQQDGTTQERAIKTGVSDWQNTEVTEGLSEGEKVVIPQSTTTTPTGQTPARGFPGGGIFR